MKITTNRAAIAAVFPMLAAVNYLTQIGRFPTLVEVACLCGIVVAVSFSLYLYVPLAKKERVLESGLCGATVDSIVACCRCASFLDGGYCTKAVKALGVPDSNSACCV